MRIVDKINIQKSKSRIVVHVVVEFFSAYGKTRYRFIWMNNFF